MPHEPRPTRLPPLARTTWAVAAVVLLGVVVGAWHYLLSRSSSSSMGGMDMGDAAALTRGGSGPLRPLFGSAIFTAWQLDAVALVVVVLLAAWYLTGVALVPVRTPGTRWPLQRTALFLAGLAVCGFATNGSIAVYDQVLFTAHMAGHLALVMLAPALLMAGRPLSLALSASQPATRERIERAVHGRTISILTAPPVALASYAAVIVGSHLTGLMNVIMRNTWAGQLEHLVYLLVGCQFFALVVGDQPLRWRLSSPARWLLLAVAMAVDTFTGVVLMQGTRAVSMLTSSRLHVDALSDTRTGGAIMWFGGDAIMAAIMVVLVVSWLRQADTVAEGSGWLEQARRTAFAEHTGAAPQTVAGDDIDDDEQARASYNAWLAQLQHKR